MHAYSVNRQALKWRGVHEEPDRSSAEALELDHLKQTEREPIEQVYRLCEHLRTYGIMTSYSSHM